VGITERVKTFLEEYRALCKKYGLMLSPAGHFEPIDVVEASEDDVDAMIKYLIERIERPIAKDLVRKWLKG